MSNGYCRVRQTQTLSDRPNTRNDWNEYIRAQLVCDGMRLESPVPMRFAARAQMRARSNSINRSRPINTSARALEEHRCFSTRQAIKRLRFFGFGRRPYRDRNSRGCVVPVMGCRTGVPFRDNVMCLGGGGSRADGGDHASHLHTLRDAKHNIASTCYAQADCIDGFINVYRELDR